MSTENLTGLSWDDLIKQDPRWERVQTAVRRLISRHEDWVNARIEYYHSGSVPYFGLRVWSREGHYLSPEYTNSVYGDGAEVVIPLVQGPGAIRHIPDLTDSGFFAAEGCALLYHVQGAGSLVRWTDEDTGALYEVQCPTHLLREVYDQYMPLYFERTEQYSVWSELRPQQLEMLPCLPDDERKPDWERELLEGENCDVD